MYRYRTVETDSPKIMTQEIEGGIDKSPHGANNSTKGKLARKAPQIAIGFRLREARIAGGYTQSALSEYPFSHLRYSASFPVELSRTVVTHRRNPKRSMAVAENPLLHCLVHA